jgi:hypothetical protein
MHRADPRRDDLLKAWTNVVALSLCLLDRVGTPRKTHNYYYDDIGCTSGVQTATDSFSTVEVKQAPGKT